jgi:S-adenosyl-L-methionine methyltransferase
LLCAGALMVSDPPLDSAALEPLPLPDGVAPGRYHLYRRG